LRFELSSVAFFLVGPFQFLVGLCISSDRPRSRDPPCLRRARGTLGTTASPDVPSFLVVGAARDHAGHVSL